MSGPLGELIDRDVLVLYLWAIGLAMARLGGMMAVLPLLGRSSVQGIVRTSIVLALSLPVVPVVVNALVAGPFPGHLFLMMLVGKELFVGVVLGLVVALPIFAMQMAGVFLDLQRGAMMAEEIGNVGTESTLLGGFLALLMITYMMVSGAFLLLLDGYVESLVVWPPAVLLPQLPETELGRIFVLADRLMSAAVLIAAPLAIAMLLVEIALAITTRFAPSINVFVLGLAIKSLVLFVIMPVYMVLIGEQTQNLLGLLGGIVPELQGFLDAGAASGTRAR